VEYEFSEVRGSNLLRVVRGEQRPGGPQRPFRARRGGDSHTRAEDLYQAVATCYFPECARISALSRGQVPPGGPRLCGFAEVQHLYSLSSGRLSSSGQSNRSLLRNCFANLKHCHNTSITLPFGCGATSEMGYRLPFRTLIGYLLGPIGGLPNSL
jgi:hypothetical protein